MLLSIKPASSNNGVGALHHDRDINAACNIRDMGLADALGCSACIKSSLVATPVRAGAPAKGVEHIFQYGAQEAPTRTADAV